MNTKIHFTYFWKTKLWPKTGDTNNKGHHKESLPNVNGTFTVSRSFFLLGILKLRKVEKLSIFIFERCSVCL